jgi:hypothetical protein
VAAVLCFSCAPLNELSLSLVVVVCAGEIPVALLRLKFVEKRTVELTGNVGLALPSNIGDLGDSVTEIDLSSHKLKGPLPEQLGSLINLTSLNLERNTLTGACVFNVSCWVLDWDFSTLPQAQSRSHFCAYVLLRSEPSS